MRASFVLACTFLVGCVSTPEVKEASATIGVSMKALQAAQLEFRDAFVAEIEETQALVGRAIVNSAVVNLVETLSQQEAEGDLMGISGAISAERRAVRAIVDAVMAAEPGCADVGCDREVVNGFLNQQPAALRRTADALEQTSPRSAAELRDLAGALEVAGPRLNQLDDLAVLVTLTRTANDVTTGMADFESYVDLLQLMHAEVDQWIVTDTKVDGVAVANLMERLSAPAQEPGGNR